MSIPAPLRLLLPALLLLTALAAPPAAAEPVLPPTDLSYAIEVTLLPETRALDGHEVITWTHTGERPIAEVPLHVYLNAFAHDDTTWMHGGPLRAVRYDDLVDLYGDIWGWSEPTTVQQLSADGPRPLKTTWIQPDDGNPLDHTLLLVTLDPPLLPGQTLTLDVRWTARLPIPIARTGGVDDFFLVAQWFPKLAAFEPRGLHGRADEGFSRQQFHGPTEFYADFADYDVRITAPPDWMIAATGARTDEDAAASGAVRYRQRAVHDFAFMASTTMSDHTLTHTPAGQSTPVEIRTIVPRGTEGQIPRWERAITSVLDTMSTRVGPWPYATLTVVAPPWRAARTGGMEYPTFITGLPGDVLWDSFPVADFEFPELVVIHEFIHQYFYGLLASNEREEAFLDEGFTTFWEGEATEALRGDASIGTVLGRDIDALAFRSLGLRRWAHTIDEPIARRPTWLYFPGTSGMQVYARTAATLQTASGLFGRDRLDAVFALYFQRFAFHHPTLSDFLAVAHELDDALGDLLDEAFYARAIPDYEVVSASTSPWRPPHGRVPGPHGPIDLGDAPDLADLDAIRPHVDEADGLLEVEITDPGYATPTDRADGRITRHRVRPDAPPPPQTDPDAPVIESRVRLRGPGWRHLPVQVTFTFADGARWTDTWDGRATWRDLRFIRHSPLTRVDLDPDHLLAVDVFPENNAGTVSPDRVFAADTSLWLSAVVQWLALGVTQWL